MNFGFWILDFGLIADRVAPAKPALEPAYGDQVNKYPTPQTDPEPKSQIPNPKSQIIVWLLLFAHLVTSVGYAMAIPIGETPDEPSHIEYVQILLRTGQLPTIPKDSPRYTYEAIQPPLFYLLEAGWMRLVWPNDKLLPPLKTNPAFSFANDNFTSTYLHDYPVVQAVPAYLMRLLSIVIGLGAVLLVWLAARLAWPEDTGAQVLALGFAALLPGMTFASGRVSNDSLSAALGAVLLLSIISMLKRGVSVRSAALVGGALGLGLLTKQSFLVFVPVVLVVPLLSPASNRQSRIVGSVVMLLAALLVGMWPFANNWVLYGDPLAAAVTGNHDLPSPLANMPFFWLAPGFILGLVNSLWGAFGLRNIELPGLIYIFYNILCLGASFGLFYVYGTRRTERSDRLIVLVALGILLLTYAGIAQYNTQVWAIQGRLLLPAFAALALLLGRGLSLLGGQLLRTHRTRLTASIGLLVIFFIINWYALITHVVQLYYG